MLHRYVAAIVKDDLLHSIARAGEQIVSLMWLQRLCGNAAARFDRIGQGALKIGLADIARTIIGRVDVGHVSGQQFMPALSKTKCLFECGNGR